MIAAFLLPYPFRGYRAPYLWMFYRLLSELNEHALFILDSDYLAMPDTWRAENRWEIEEHSQLRLGYQLPTQEVFARHTYRFVGESAYYELLGTAGSNPLAAFRLLLTERIPVLEKRLSACLDERRDIEAILTWCNCPSLNAVASELGVSVVHLEMGPLRLPDFRRPTAYFDFSGVNGNTEAAFRYAESPLDSVDATVQQLHAFFSGAFVLPADVGRVHTGVVLQVEDDSNLIAFGHGFDNQALIVSTHLQYAGGRVLVRPHPGSLFGLRENWYEIDNSTNSAAFIRRCERILTINSSVGLEAILMDTPVTVLGDCSYSFILEARAPADLRARLAYYLFAYLIPMQLVFDLDYLRFRLSRPSDSQIVIRHLDTYLGGDVWRKNLDCNVVTASSAIGQALNFAVPSISEIVLT